MPAGGPYFKWPWERVCKVNVAADREYGVDPKDPQANESGQQPATRARESLSWPLAPSLACAL